MSHDSSDWEDVPGCDDGAESGDEDLMAMVLVVNTSLNMKPGKVAAQVRTPRCTQSAANRQELHQIISTRKGFPSIY